MRHYVDHSQEEIKKGLFILTGSTKPYDSSLIKHSGAGRILTLNMQTLTFAEILDNNESNSISITELRNGQYKAVENNLSIDEFNKMLLVGG